MYRDGSEYRGALINGVKCGHGHFVWPSQCESGEYGHQYLGTWRDGMMSGQGRFHHRDGLFIESTFVNNLFLSEEGYFVNPYLNAANKADYLSRINRRISDEQNDIKLAREKISVHRVEDADQLVETLRKVRANGRTPLVVSATENPIDIQTIVAAIGERQSDDTATFNTSLRDLFNEYKFDDWPRFRHKMYENVQEALGENQKVVFNLVLDEEFDQTHWSEQYDPDLDIIFGKNGVPQAFWRGDSIYNNIETAPEPIQALVDFRMSADKFEAFQRRHSVDPDHEQSQPTG